MSNSILIDKIKELAKQYFNDCVADRRHLHAHPELSFQEVDTCKYIQTRLRDYGIKDIQVMAGTGVVVLIKGKYPDKKTIALRADIDALPIKEQNDVSYKSCNEGVMHACGHDVHAASLLTCARILHQMRDDFEGTVKLLFQPGEELIPGGASLMIKEGVLENPNPSSIFGQHVMTFMPVGKVGFRPGMYMASADELYLTIKGKGGHAAMPDNNIDPILITSHIIVALQQIVSRVANPKIPSVLSFGKVIAEGATNVIPNEVKVEGTFRTLNEEWRTNAHVKMRKMAEGIAEAMGGSCEFEIRKGYPFLKNAEKLTLDAKAAAIQYIGADNVVDLDMWMAAEDFAFYTQHIDACFYRLGVRNEAKGIVSGVHTPTFDIDENALEIGSGMMAWLAINELAL